MVTTVAVGAEDARATCRAAGSCRSEGAPCEVRRYRESFNDSIFLTCNMPPLHLVNYDGFAKDWVKGGTQRLGTYKSAGKGGGWAERGVWKRSLRSSAGTCLRRRCRRCCSDWHKAQDVLICLYVYIR